MKVKNVSLGLTLIELLAGLSLLALVFFFSLPMAPSLYQKNQLQKVKDEIKSAIHYAKIQAVITGNTLALTHLPGANDWSEGMLLFIDNSKHQYTPESKLLHEWRWKSAGINVAWNGFQSVDYLLFTPEISSSTVNGSFIITNSKKEQTKLVVNRLGRVSLNPAPSPYK